MARITKWIEAFALSIGAPGLFIIAFLDSSFLSFPEVNDLLIVLMVINHPERMVLYATMATLGSVAGCLALYYVGRRGGNALLQKRFKGGMVERASNLMRKYGALALIVPALLPPPAPFKIFVLLGGVANIPLKTFIVSIAFGRGVRYFGEGILAVMYGKQALEYIHENSRTVGIALGLLVLVAGDGVLPLEAANAGRPEGRPNCLNACIMATSRGQGPLDQIMNPELSVVIPIRNESPNIEALYVEMTEALERWGRSYEVLAIDDGSTDDSFDRLVRCQKRDPRWRIIRFRRNFGQTAAFSAGFRHARGRFIATADGDLQNDPRDLSDMIRRVEEGSDIVCGWRKDRKDPWLTRRLPSELANKLISWSTGVKLHDYGCSLKVFRADVVKPLKLYGEMHRFLPAIASEMGVTIDEVVVNHRARKHGHSNYGLSRTFRVVLDLLTVKFLLSYSTRPLQMFGLIGVPMGFLGFLIAAYLSYRAALRPGVDRQSSASAARRTADFLGYPARDDGSARRNHGAHVSRVAGQADLRDSGSLRIPAAGTAPAFIERLGGQRSSVFGRARIRRAVAPAHRTPRCGAHDRHQRLRRWRLDRRGAALPRR